MTLVFSDRRPIRFRLPTRVEAGNQFGTEAFFPFFIAEVTAVRFPSPLLRGR